MNLPAICIRRPAFTIVISLVMIIIGLIGFMHLPVRWIPNVSQPLVSISTEYPGANANLVEKNVTRTLEGVLSGINGIETLDSNSRQGMSHISIRFKLGVNMNAAVEDVRSSLERVRGSLPKDAENPVVSKADDNADAILYISFDDANKSARALSDYITKYIVPSFETLDGVGSVGVFGQRLTAMHIWLDPTKMAGANVTVDEVSQLLQSQNASLPSGEIRGNDRTYSIFTDTTLASERQFNDLIIRDNQNQVVRLSDIGQAELGPEDEDSAFRVNGKSAVALGIVPQSTANPLEVEQRVQKLFSNLQRTLPKGMHARILFNQADYIRASIHSVYESFAEAVFFVWIVILAFLCSFRATFVPIITIPVCLVSTFALLYFLGFSINTITLMAFVLAIGLVVDDAIVMLENISRHHEAGLSAFQAALKGSSEMIFPVIAMTLTLAAVYAPIAFTEGLLGALFREFTFTLAGAVIISGFVALTLSPMMCARVLTKISAHNVYQKWQVKQFTRLQTFYRNILDNLLTRRKWVVLALVAVGILGYVVFRFIPAELAPQEDMNLVFVSMAAPNSASFEYTDSYVKQVEDIFKKMPDINAYFSITGKHMGSHAFALIMLQPKNQRKHDTQEIIHMLESRVNKITGLQVNVFTPPPPLADVTGSDSGDSLGMTIMTTGSYKRLQQVSSQILDIIKPLPIFAHADNSLKWDSEQFNVNINNEKAADLRVPLLSISNTLSTLIAGKLIGKMDESNIFVQIRKEVLSNPDLFSHIYVRNLDNRMIPLSSLINVSQKSSSQEFRHSERLRADRIYMTLAPGQKVSTAVKTLEKIARENIPDDMHYQFTGEAKNFLDSNGKTTFTFMLALIFIYLVLVAQFESFVDPLIILFTVPFAVVGAFITLKLFGGTRNIYSNIGLITLIGLIAKHGILITDFANRLRSQGKSIHEAVVEAALLRLRPILMTTAAMVLGTLPLAFATGPGAESRQQVGLVITGGLLFGTFFSLIVVPVAYTYFARFRKQLVQETEHATSH